MLPAIIIHIILCFIAASAGSNRTIGYWSTFAYSLIFSPVIGIIIALCSQRVNTYRCPSCKHQMKALSTPKRCPKCGAE